MRYKVVSLFHHASVQDIKYIDVDTLYEECTKRHQKGTKWCIRNSGVRVTACVANRSLCLHKERRHV